MARIWVVDDEPLIRHAIVSVLEDVGHQPEGFGDAEELYHNLVTRQESLPELLILDHMLPDESGAQIVHSLRERAEYRDIPVLFVTAVDDQSAERLSDLAPVVRKPFDFRDLMTAVDDRLAATDAPGAFA